jgi:hypothetical protein
MVVSAHRCKLTTNFRSTIMSPRFGVGSHARICSEKQLIITPARPRSRLCTSAVLKLDESMMYIVVCQPEAKSAYIHQSHAFVDSLRSCLMAKFTGVSSRSAPDGVELCLPFIFTPPASATTPTRSTKRPFIPKIVLSGGYLVFYESSSC